MDCCSRCPHPNECLKVGACLDELNAAFVETTQPPRSMTAFTAHGRHCIHFVGDCRYRNRDKQVTLRETPRRRSTAP
jgi:hypothetical protein